MEPRLAIVEEEIGAEAVVVTVPDELAANSGLAAPAPVHHAPLIPSRIRLACLLVVAVYPLITVLLYVLTPLTAGWDIWHRTIVITPIMVFSIIFLVSPAINRHFGWFVLRRRAR